MTRILILILVLLISFVRTGQLFSAPWHQIAQNVLDELFDASSDYRFSKPSLGFTTASQDVAYYLASKNTLIIEEQTFSVCRMMGKDSVNALAFIIGHELSHMYQEEMHTQDFISSFLTYDKNIHARIRTEKQADIQGAFNAFLAGYKTQGLISRLLVELYNSYGLLDKELSGYPTLEERKTTASEVSGIVDDLILLYDISPMLSIIGKYQYASSAYEYIGQYYRGGEVLNNLGLNYLLEAINLTDYNLDRFAFPIEFNSESRLKKPKVLYGAKDFDIAAFTHRIQLIEKANNNFEEAIQQNKNNPISLLNLATTYVLLGKYKEALDILNITLWPDPLRNKSQILKSIILFDLDEKNKPSAIKMLEQIQQQGTGADQQLARLNIQIMSNENTTVIEEIANCDFIQSLSVLKFDNKSVKQIQINTGSGTTLDYMSTSDIINVRFNSLFGAGLILTRYVTSEGTKSFNINKLQNIFAFEKGFAALCPKEKQIIVFDTKGVIKYRIAYQDQ
ncbi:MAG: tetratricopeptide repeat protein [Saprospiraceae bacterium]